MKTQTDIGYETSKNLWYINDLTNTRQFLGVQLVKDSNIKLDNVIIDTYAWAHDRYGNSSNGRVRFFDDMCVIKRQGAIADSIEVIGSSKFNFIKLPSGDIEFKYNLETFDWTMTLQDKEYITRNITGLVSAHLLKERKRFVIEQPKSVLYSKEITLIDSNLGIEDGN